MKRQDKILVQEILEGGVSKDTFDEFQRRIVSEEDLLKEYGQYAILNHTLEEEFEDAPKNFPIGKSSASSFSPWPLWLLGIAAVLCVTGICIALLWQPSKTDKGIPFMAIAHGEFSADALWRIEGNYQKNKSKIQLATDSTLTLERGSVELHVSKNQRLILRAPAELSFNQASEIQIGRGTATVYVENSPQPLRFKSPSLILLASQAIFGIKINSAKPTDVQVIEGSVNLQLDGSSIQRELTHGQAVKVSTMGDIMPGNFGSVNFPRQLTKYKTISLGGFSPSRWKLEHGTPNFGETSLEGKNFSVFHHLTEKIPDLNGGSILVTMHLQNSALGDFHTDGWAGLSFYNEGNEVLFFGDGFGPARTWALDVKQKYPLILPADSVMGPQEVTLWYQASSGEVSLHQGGTPLGKPFCVGKIAPHTQFDSIRIAASAEAALNVRSLTLQIASE
ncbi:MAG: hypothetical protein EAZ42_08835 [Verrucomicrobia bacterium]|nr:MAG: hypothetical protein EAZ42_08835 [Verrucomicrobiota bacterium]